MFNTLVNSVIVVNWTVSCIWKDWKDWTCVFPSPIMHLDVSCFSLSHTPPVPPFTSADSCELSSTGWEGRGTNFSRSPVFSRLFCRLPESHPLVYPVNASSNIILLSVFLQALDNVPVLLYILALKTLLLCLLFAGVKIYQGKKAEAALKKQQAERRRLAQETQNLIDNSKED